MTNAKIKSVSAGEKPSEQVVKSSQKEFSTTDALGRVITLRKPSTWQKFELPRILGAESANPGWMFQAMMILHVVRIGDDDDVFFRNERELKAVVNSLGDEGMEAVEQLYIEHFIPKLEDQREAVKK